MFPPNHNFSHKDVDICFGYYTLFAHETPSIPRKNKSSITLFLWHNCDMIECK